MTEKTRQGAFLPRLAFVVAMLAPGCTFADVWSALKEPGTIGLMRHALAPGTGDPVGFEIDDCSTQRNLDARGRDQAVAIGAALRLEGFFPDHLLSSAWCRCRETAELLNLGEVVVASELNSFYQRPESGEAQTKATLERLDLLEGTALLVTHQVNITALTGAFPRSGEIIVVRPKNGRFSVVERILIEP